MSYVTISDINILFRELKQSEIAKAEALIPIVEDRIRTEAKNLNKDIDFMVMTGALSKNTLKSVIIDVIGRTLMTSTEQEPMIQGSESALGYVQSGTFLVPGGGIFIKKSELATLGLKRQTMGVVDLC